MNLFENIIIIIFQNVFRIKIHQNYFFIFKKLFLILTYKHSHNIQVVDEIQGLHFVWYDLHKLKFIFQTQFKNYFS
jgi:hypothetical protein